VQLELGGEWSEARVAADGGALEVDGQPTNVYGMRSRGR
jgi:hypothetical protein